MTTVCTDSDFNQKEHGIGRSSANTNGYKEKMNQGHSDIQEFRHCAPNCTLRDSTIRYLHRTAIGFCLVIESSRIIRLRIFRGKDARSRRRSINEMIHCGGHGQGSHMTDKPDVVGCAAGDAEQNVDGRLTRKRNEPVLLLRRLLVDDAVLPELL